MTRVLFIAEAVTLAHVARAYTLARGLHARGDEVVFACDARYHGLLGEIPFATRPLYTIPTTQFLHALAQGAPLYDLATLRRYVEDDARLLDEVRPDVVVGDFRLSLSISAARAAVPYLNITNAYWSPHAQVRYPVPELPLTRIVGVGVAQWLFDRVRPWVFAQHARPLARVRRHYGLSPLRGDLRTAYTHGDFTLYADLPELVPTTALPASHRFLGPILWAPAVSLPPWWADLPVERPLVYVNLGSSGQGASLPSVLQALAGQDITVVAATAGAAWREPLPQNVFVADYLPGDAVAARAAVVVCNGGSPTCYQALAAGVPVLGLPSNLDQYLNMSLVAQAGAGLTVRAGQANAATLSEALSDLFTAAQYRNAAVRLQAAIAHGDSVAVLADTVSKARGHG